MQARRSIDRQAGVVFVEMALCLLVLVTLLAGALQLGRALYAYHVLVTATNSAALYLATAPASELSAGGKARANAIINRMVSGAKVDTANSSVLVTVQCTPMNSAPCVAGAPASRVTVRAQYIVLDTILPNFTWSNGLDIQTIILSAETTVPRAGFY